MLVDDAIMKNMNYANSNAANGKGKQYQYQEDEYSGDEEYDNKQ